MRRRKGLPRGHGSRKRAAFAPFAVFEPGTEPGSNAPRIGSFGSGSRSTGREPGTQPGLEPRSVPGSARG